MNVKMLFVKSRRTVTLGAFLLFIPQFLGIFLFGNVVEVAVVVIALSFN